MSSTDSSRLAAVVSAVADALGISPATVSQAAALALFGLAALGTVPLLRRYGRASGDKSTSPARVLSLVVAYSLCSSMLLILNKVAVTHIPAPSTILLCQLLSCSVFVKGLAVAKVVDAEPLQLEKVKAFALIVFGFIGTLFSSMTALQFVPVDTIICFRASTPLIIAVIEFFYLEREWPSLRSWLALIGVLGGVIAYTAQDIHFTPLGYMWIGIWYAFAVFEQVWVKKVVDTVAMTTWSRTYYQNTLAVGPVLLLAVLTGETRIMLGTHLRTAGLTALVLSCLGGLGMSYFSFALRACISATSFSVIGNVCKVLTILVNVALWDQHAGTGGIIALLACLGLAGMYQQPPLKSSAKRPIGSTGLQEKASLLPTHAPSSSTSTAKAAPTHQ